MLTPTPSPERSAASGTRVASIAAALALIAIPVTLLPIASAAQAEVRFGRNVRVGGHDFSNQSFNRNRRAVIHIYDRTPQRPGCVWRADGQGGKVKVCHLRRIR